VLEAQIFKDRSPRKTKVSATDRRNPERR